MTVPNKFRLCVVLMFQTVNNYADRYNPIVHITNLLAFIIIIITINIFGKPFLPRILTYLAKTE
jgi:hypothetical protein